MTHLDFYKINKQLCIQSQHSQGLSASACLIRQVSKRAYDLHVNSMQRIRQYETSLGLNAVRVLVPSWQDDSAAKDAELDEVSFCARLWDFEL